GFDKPTRWITSARLRTLGFGLPAALAAQLANPGRLVIDSAGDASVQTTMKELSTAIQHQAPNKIFILSDEHPGMARDW
ncbi:thiamine pyrophosphate-dependent enzyme, partial [Rhizobium ruizarguesonis]